MVTHKRRGSDVPGGEPDTTYVWSRAEDRSPLLRISYLWDKYRIFIYAGVGYLLASGYQWKTPAQHNAEVKARVDTLHQMIQTDRVRATEVERKMDVLIRFRCLEISSDPKVASLIDLDCDAFLRWRPQPPPEPGSPTPRIRPSVLRTTDHPNP